MWLCEDETNVSQKKSVGKMVRTMEELDRHPQPYLPPK